MLALGICASVSIFAFVDAALIKPLPYDNPTRLVHGTESVAVFPRANLSYLDYVDWKKMNKVFSSLQVYTGNGAMLSTPSGTVMVGGAALLLIIACVNVASLLLIREGLTDISYGKDNQAADLQKQSINRISVLPGVKSVGIATSSPSAATAIPTGSGS